MVEASDREALWECATMRPYMLEERIQQHRLMAGLYPRAVNTVRVLTVIDGSGSARIVAAALRCGRGDMVTDSGGGLFAPVDLASGRVTGNAFSHMRERFKVHPDTSVRFEGFELPDAEALWERVRQAALVQPGLVLANWDWACREDGAWILIEGNVDGGIGACQEALGRGLASELREALGSRVGE